MTAPLRRGLSPAWFTSPALTQLHLDAALAQAVRALREAGVEPLLLKGPALARWLYEDPADRAYGDVDLLVAPAEVPVARTVLTELGYTERVIGDREDERLPHAALFARGTALVDLHWQLILLPRTDARALLGRDAHPLAVAGADVLVPATPGLALVVALHAAQHGEQHTPAVADLRRALGRAEPEVWRRAASLAREAGVDAAMRAGLRLVEGGDALADRLGLPARVPLDLRMRIEAVHGVSRLAAIQAAPTWPRRVYLLASTVFPSAAFMRFDDPRARRGHVGLVQAYAVRLVRLARRTPPTIRAYARQLGEPG